VEAIATLMPIISNNYFSVDLAMMPKRLIGIESGNFINQGCLSRYFLTLLFQSHTKLWVW